MQKVYHFLCPKCNNNHSFYRYGKEATGTVGRDSAVTVAYTNDLPYEPIVGLAMDALPFALLAILGFGTFGIIMFKKRKALSK